MQPGSCSGVFVQKTVEKSLRLPHGGGVAFLVEFDAIKEHVEFPSAEARRWVLALHGSLLLRRAGGSLSSTYGHLW